MREELIKLLQERVGLDRQQAETAADVAIEFIKQRSPEQIRSLIGGEGPLGGIFGR
ncbi:MAG: hypothetical protein HYY30_14920 [Chloroflexi bacterium]|nr:hypothetical protein [Chloroflexota bacterium]